jgi:hypothetical protein
MLFEYVFISTLPLHTSAVTHLVPRSRMRGAIPPRPQYAFVAPCSVKNARRQIYLLPCPSSSLSLLLVSLVSPSVIMKLSVKGKTELLTDGYVSC